jgi:hypothetical protein
MQRIVKSRRSLLTLNMNVFIIMVEGGEEVAMTATMIVLAGLAHLGLVGVGSQVPRAFRWKAELATLGPANRRLFWVYGFFIILANVGFGALSLAYAVEIAAGRGIAGGFALFLGLYWTARLVTQYAVFTTPDFPEEGRRPLVKHGMGLLFLLMSAVYFAAFAQGRLA